MEWVGCTPKPECKYYPDCFTDRHHAYGQALASSALEQTFGELPENVWHGCRRYHEEYEVENGWLPYPEKEEMIQAVQQAEEDGVVYISKRKRRQIYGEL